MADKQPGLQMCRARCCWPSTPVCCCDLVGADVAVRAAAIGRQRLEAGGAGVPDTSQAYELTPPARNPADIRVAGGTRITLDEFGLTAQVLLANDPATISVVDRLRRQSTQGRRIAA